MPSRRVVTVFWLVVLGAALLLGFNTTRFILMAGLYAERPPLPWAHTALRFAIIVGSMVITFVARDRFLRATVLIAAVAAASTALFGLGLRSAPLSAFRLISHLVAYILIITLAIRKLSSLYT